MATESQLGKAAEKPAVTSKTLDYEQKLFRHSTYNYVPQFPNTYGQTIALGTSQSFSVIQIPPEVFNLSRSYLVFTLNLPAVANNYIWTYADVIGPIAHLQHYCSVNQWIVDLDNANKYLKAIKSNMSMQELMTMDPSSGMSCSNSLANVVPALRNGGSIGIVGGAGPAPSEKNFIEPAYFNVGALNTAVTVNYNIPLSIYKDTMLAIDKDMYYGVQSYLKIYWDVLSRICYMSTSNANPSAGALADYTGVAPNISNLQLMLALESAPPVIAHVKQQITSGLEYMIPFAQNNKVSNSGSTQSITQQLDMGLGHSLAKVLHQVYNNTEENDTAYDCANNGNLVTNANADNSANQKVLAFYSQLNGSRETDLTLLTNNTQGGQPGYLDYMIMKRRLKGSCLESLNSFQYNWVYARDYCDWGAEGNFEGRDELISGIPLGTAPLVWTFYGQSMVARNYQHYQWYIFYRKLKLNGNGAYVH